MSTKAVSVSSIMVSGENIAIMWRAVSPVSGVTRETDAPCSRRNLAA